MKPDILLVEPMMPEIEMLLDDAYRVHRSFIDAGNAALVAALPNIRAAVVSGGSGLSNEWIEKLPALGLIAVNGVGTDRIDLAFARSRNIDVATTLGVLTEDVANLAVALMLAVLRRVTAGDRFVREGRWGKEGFPLATSPRGKRLGILGLGSIGRAIGRQAEVFGMSVRYWNRSPVTDTAWIAAASPLALAEDSDVLVVCVAAGAATHNIVNGEVLAALGPKGVLVNIARGSVVDETALLAALQDGTIAGAGLDVFVNEPAIRPEFLSAPNTVLMPHQGSATVETRNAMGRLVLDNLAAFYAGERPLTVVN